MLNTKLLVLAALWFVGLLLHVAGNPIHLLIGLTLCVLLVDAIGSRRRTPELHLARRIRRPANHPRS